MQMPKTPASRSRLVWRISENAPSGEWVDPAKIKARRSKLAEPEVSSGSWVSSSFDLLNGVDIVEGTEAMTPELFDELFKVEVKDAKTGKS